MKVPVINIKPLRTRILHGKLAHLALEKNPSVNMKVEFLQTRAPLQWERPVRNTRFLPSAGAPRKGAMTANTQLIW